MEKNERTGLNLKEIKKLKTDLTRFMMAYKFALDEMTTKINILMEEFKYIHEYNPIEHVTSRLKSPESIFNKVIRKGYEFSLEGIRENVRDIAGVRITCSFLSDIYIISEMLQRQKDIRVLEVKDYIQEPKANGYRSLHLILEIPIFMSDREIIIPVEVQIRTIAMDFWASLEHKIFYKYNKAVPQYLIEELRKAATVASQLDKKMEQIHREMNKIKGENREEEKSLFMLNIEREMFELPIYLLESLSAPTTKTS